MQKAYSRTTWENYPSDNTPLNETNLNHLEAGVDEIDNRVISLDTTKFDKTEAAGLIKSFELDTVTGIITITKYNGSVTTIDTLLEKIAVNFDFDAATQKIIITLDDGTTKEIDLSAFITQYEFLDSDTIGFTVDGAGKVTAIVKEGSIEEKHLRPNYLAEIKTEAAKAEASKTAAAESAKNAGISETNSAKSADEANTYAENASDKAGDANNSATAAYNAALSAEQAKTDAQNLVTDVTNKINSGYFKGDKGDTGETGPKGDTGEQGPKGDKGDTGENGVVTPVNGFFTMSVDADGNLYVCSADGTTTPEFELDTDGNLYFITED